MKTDDGAHGVTRPTTKLKLTSLLDTRIVYCGDNLEQFAKLSIPSPFGDISNRLHWVILHAWNVICLRRWLVIAIVLVFLFVTVLCSLTMLPTYSSTCTISMEPSVIADY